LEASRWRPHVHTPVKYGEVLLAAGSRDQVAAQSGAEWLAHSQSATAAAGQATRNRGHPVLNEIVGNHHAPRWQGCSRAVRLLDTPDGPIHQRPFDARLLENPCHL